MRPKTEHPILVPATLGVFVNLFLLGFAVASITATIAPSVFHLLKIGVRLLPDTDIRGADVIITLFQGFLTISTFFPGFLIISGAVLFPILIYLGRRKARVQLARNEAVTRAKLQQTRSHFLLFLRPLASGAEVNISLDGDLAQRFAFGERWNLELELSVRLFPELEIKAIGDKMQSFGADKIRTSDEDWKQVASLMMSESIAIVMIPDNSPGVRWELQKIIGTPELLSKSFFVQPRIWYKMWRILPTYGITIPDAQPAGQLIYYGKNPTEPISIPLDGLRYIDTADLIDASKRGEMDGYIRSQQKHISRMVESKENTKTFRSINTPINKYGVRKFVRVSYFIVIVMFIVSLDISSVQFFIAPFFLLVSVALFTARGVGPS